MEKYIVKVEQSRSSSFILEANDEAEAQKIIDFMGDDELAAKAFGADGKDEPEYTNLDVMIKEELPPVVKSIPKK